MSFLFGTLTESDLSNICQAINDLSGNQQTVVHFLEEQMTILNVSRVHIAVNRQALLDLVECLNTFESRMNNLTQAIQERFKHVEMCLECLRPNGSYFRRYKGCFATWKPLFRESMVGTKYAVP